MEEKRNKKIMIGLILAILAVLGFIIYVVLFWGKNSKKEQTTNEPFSISGQETTKIEEETTKEVNHDNDMHSYFTGKWISKKTGKKRPIAVMFNNLYDALPQVGIAKSDIIYEAEVEGGITRLMGIIQQYDELERIGSVRSCRLVFAEIAAEYNAIYLHYGQSKYALPFLQSDAIDNLSGMESVGNVVYYRAADRYAPHNAFTSKDGIVQGMEQMGYSAKIEKGYQSPFSFAEDETEVKLSKAQKANRLDVPYPVNTPYFIYNKNKKLYYRYQYNQAQIDERTGKQLSCKNIILQYLPYTYFENGESQNYYNVGEGSGKYLTNGRAVDITWKKESINDVTHYYDKKGNELVLNQGKTWICLIGSEKQENVVISK